MLGASAPLLYFDLLAKQFPGIPLIGIVLALWLIWVGRGSKILSESTSERLERYFSLNPRAKWRWFLALTCRRFAAPLAGASSWAYVTVLHISSIWLLVAAMILLLPSLILDGLMMAARIADSGSDADDSPAAYHD